MARELRRHVSLRVAETAVSELDRAAERRGLSRNELAERYLVEGVRSEEHTSELQSQR